MYMYVGFSSPLPGGMFVSRCLSGGSARGHISKGLVMGGHHIPEQLPPCSTAEVWWSGQPAGHAASPLLVAFHPALLYVPHSHHPAQIHNTCLPANQSSPSLTCILSPLLRLSASSLISCCLFCLSLAADSPSSTCACKCSALCCNWILACRAASK